MRGYDPVDESDYWGRLEYRVCHELAGLSHIVGRLYWCDGFVPDQYILDGPSPCILGRAWLVIGSNYDELWAFTLLLNRSVLSVEEIDWSALLPADDVTRWLTVDRKRKQLILEPSIAVPDKAPPTLGGKFSGMDRPGGRAF